MSFALEMRMEWDALIYGKAGSNNVPIPFLIRKSNYSGISKRLIYLYNDLTDVLTQANGMYSSLLAVRESRLAQRAGGVGITQCRLSSLVPPPRSSLLLSPP